MSENTTESNDAQPSGEDEEVLQEIYNLVHERVKEHEDHVDNLPQNVDLDSTAVKVGKYRAYDEMCDDLLKALDPDTYEQLHGSESDAE